MIELFLQSHLGHQGLKAQIIFISDTRLAPSSAISGGASYYWTSSYWTSRGKNSNHNTITNRSAESAGPPKILTPALVRNRRGEGEDSGDFCWLPIRGMGPILYDPLPDRAIASAPESGRGRRSRTSVSVLHGLYLRQPFLPWCLAPWTKRRRPGCRRLFRQKRASID